MDAGIKAYSMMVLAYRDYIAARFLLNSKFITQGLTLASSAVEKYMKVPLVAQGKNQKAHLNNIDKLKKLLSENYYDITQKIDPTFLKILSDTYLIRYYDDYNIKSPITIGFFLNQFLGELDYVANLFETVIIKEFKDAKGKLITPYHSAIEERNEDLFKNNYILNGVTKKEHMEKTDTGFLIYVHPKSLAHGEIRVIGSNIKNIYDGQIMEIKLEFNQSKKTHCP